jgi:nucleotide-binding universal stress UspA family protein
MHRAEIVVGVSGSAAGTAAVRWAAAEASIRKARLRLLVAHQRRTSGVRFRSRGELLRATGRQAAEVLDAAVREARSVAPDVDVSGAAVLGEPVPVLLDAAAGADLVVVGGRGRGRLGQLLGSVTSQVATYAPCSVAVVREREEPAGDVVVLGIDESPSAAAAAALAFAETALRRSARLLAVTAYPKSPPAVTAGPLALPADADAEEARLREDLAEQLAPWRDKHPGVTVHSEIVDGDPGAVLADRSQQAQLVVVGAGSCPGFEGLRLGSVVLHLLHHADCPVLIARPR